MKKYQKRTLHKINPLRGAKLKWLKVTLLKYNPSSTMYTIKITSKSPIFQSEGWKTDLYEYTPNFIKMLTKKEE